MKRILLSLLTVALIFSQTTTALAEDGNVNYLENANQFIFAPGGEYSLTDLFPNFKDVMPGDTLSQRIVIKNDARHNVNIKVYMHSLGSQEGFEEFLSQMNLRVVQMTETELFEAPADETAQLTDWVYLGRLSPGGTIELDVTLEVPVTMSSEYMGRIGFLDWEFMVEEFPVPDPVKPPVTPDTGDNAPIGAYVAMITCSLAGILLLLKEKRKVESRA